MDTGISVGSYVGKINLKHVHIGDRLIFNDGKVIALVEVLAIEQFGNVRYQVIECLGGDKDSLSFNTTLNWTDPCFLYFLPGDPSS